MAAGLRGGPARAIPNGRAGALPPSLVPAKPWFQYLRFSRK